MPLVRFQLRNEHALGKPELYSEASREDPKAVLDGVAVAGLVGILRQLGDLADFAAEVFHGLQEQAMTTASRSHNLLGRVQRIEAALPSLEKRVLAQTSHVHFAYTAGSDWHARIRNEQHHFIDNDLPRFIMDSYEECCDPPRLHLLDKFETGGPGSCLRRYSDPTFFRRVSMRIDESNPVKIRRDKKARKIKKKKSLLKNGEFSRGNSLSSHGSRLRFSSALANGQASPTVSMEDLTFDSGMGDRLNSFDSRSGSGYIECIFSQSDNMQLNERASNRSSSSRLMQHEDSVGSFSRDEESFNASSITRKKGFKTSSAQLMQHEDSIGSMSCEEGSASIASSTRKKVSKALTTQQMQHEDSIGSVSHEEESPSIASSMRKKSSKASSTKQMQHEDSVGSVSCEDSGTSISSSTRKKGSKSSSTLQMQHGDSVGSVSCEDSGPSISSSTRKKGSKSSSTLQMQHGDSVGSVSCEDSGASISSSTRKKGSKSSSTLQMQHGDSVGSVSREENSATISSSMRKKGSKAESTADTLHVDHVGSSALLMQHVASVGPVSQEEESTAISSSSHSPPRTLQECAASNLSSVTWEEKTEITQTIERNICRDVASELVFPHLNVCEREDETLIATKVDELDIPRNGESLSKPITDEDQTDDIDSEIDHYVDALNTIESESETDHDYQTKREVEKFSYKAQDREKRVAVEELTSHSLDHYPSNVESDVASNVISDKRMPLDLPEAAASEISAEEQVPEVAVVSANSDCLPDINVCQNYVLDDSKVETATHEPSSPGSSQSQDEIRSSSSKHQEFPVKLADVDFWTNGGLLGLQPAKPPVFAPTDNPNVDSNPSVPASMPKDDDGREKLHLGENDEVGPFVKKTTLVSSLSDPSPRIDNSCQSNHTNVFGHTNGHGSSSISVVAPGSAVPIAPTAQAAPAETTKENDDNSSGVFGLGHRLFVNSFRKKLSLVYDEKPDLPSSDISLAGGQHEPSHQTVVDGTCMDQFETISPVNSFPPSPPLEHMKISFHPVNDFETSKLGLKFSDESNSREKVRDMFASFQLVPQPAVQLDGGGFDSDDDDDDDTFCRSSPNSSNDYMSNHSESNSEQWESDAHDALGRVSMESASAPTSYANHAKEAVRLDPDNGVEPIHSFPGCVSGQGLNLPSFDAIKSFPKQEKDVMPEPRSNDFSLQSPGQPTPPPPPLPPADWRGVKPGVDVAEDVKEASAALNNAIHSNHLASHVQPQPKLTPVRPQNIVKEIVQVAMERKDQLKSNANKESFPEGANGLAPDDKEDFLQQIRAKSFNLRRTATAKTTAPTQAVTANVKVCAILKKANAIRQAVGSDDGEDDSWSDT
ncbi:hypothetical protein CDL15_Pgr019360 [Punica granatum]|uniref:Protein SCAR n=1 Tax=Punica granatum TaxID=22663 RepID=A0A218X679_PUNGR|nr:hypothetical protein CDL15_Pgr019360 [Punica granatum]